METVECKPLFLRQGVGGRCVETRTTADVIVG
jgi:hypothetical protein